MNNVSVKETVFLWIVGIAWVLILISLGVNP